MDAKTKVEKGLLRVILNWRTDPETQYYSSFLDLFPLTRDTAKIVISYIPVDIDLVAERIRRITINEYFKITIASNHLSRSIYEIDITVPTHGLMIYRLKNVKDYPKIWELDVGVAGWWWRREVEEPFGENENPVLRYFPKGLVLETKFGTLTIPPDRNDITWRDTV